MSEQQKQLLQEVIERYEQWRAIKKGGEKTPEELWVLARQLVGHYKRSHICKALGLNSTQYKRYILQQLEVKKVKIQSPSFIEAPFKKTLDSMSLQSKPTLVITRKDGVAMTLQNLVPEQIAMLMNQFLQ